MRTRVIDMRSRPSFLHDFYGATPGTNDYEVVKWLNRKVGSKDDEHFIRSNNVTGFIEEIRENGITESVVIGRDTPGIQHSNDEIYKLTFGHKELVGLGSVDPLRVGIKAATIEVDRAVNKLGMKGINLEPGYGSEPMRADDRRLYPIYDTCDQLNAPVSIMSGPTSPSLEMTNPESIFKIASEFPNLSIICYHGFYPYVNEIIGAAFRYENISISADMYIFCPGGSLYVEAANGFMKEQLLFGSSYPFRAMGQSIEDYQQLGFKDDVIDYVLYKNAQRILKLPDSPARSRSKSRKKKVSNLK